MNKYIENLVCIIPARSGSKGLKNKNMLYLVGKPLIFHTIDAAINSGVFRNEDIYVSTDSEEYKKIIETNRPIKVLLRNEKLATDKSTTFDVLEDFLEGFSNDTSFMLCQPTSPLRSGNTILNAYKEFIENDCDNLVSFSEADKSLNLFTTIDEDGCPKEVIGVDRGYRRQDEKKQYYPNGAIFITGKTNYLEHKSFFTEKTRAYIMDKKESIDVDDKNDFIKAAGSIYFDYEKREVNNKEFYRNKYSFFSNEPLKSKLIIGDSRVESINITGFSNIAVGGITLHTAYENLDLILNTRKFEEVFISLGVNDLITKYSLESIKDIFDKIILKLLDKGIKVIISKIIYTIFRVEVDNDDILELNEYLSELANKKKIIIIDPNPIICNNKSLRYDYTSDGLHMNQTSNNILMDFYKENLEMFKA